jgi:HicB-like protein involved in pilus formation
MPAGLHEQLARESDRNGVSLNQFITSILAGSVGWGRADATPLEPRRARSRWPGVLLVTNLVLVAAAAVSAIAFLIAAWVS